ncbi:conserved hypothetical protein [uncultured Gammaproteobacteria bacterium]
MAATVGKSVEAARAVIGPRTFGDHPHGKATDQRSRHHPNPHRRSLYDLLFDEVDEIDGLTEPQKQKIKHNIRGYFSNHQEEAEAGTTVPPSVGLAELLEVVVPADGSLDPHQVVNMVLRSQDHAGDHRESELITEQLRLCLSLHTERARKISLYLRALLILDGQDFRPHTIVEA